MGRTRLGIRWFVITLFFVNNVRITHNQYYYIEGKRPVYIIDDSNAQSPIRTKQTIAPKFFERDASNSRSLEDFGSFEAGEVQYIHKTGDDPVDENPSGGEVFTFSHEMDDSVESAKLNHKPESLESSEANLRGDPGKLFDFDEDGRLPEPRLFFKGWPVRFEYKETWKGRRQEAPKMEHHPYVRPTSLVDPKFYDSKFYYKFAKKRYKRKKKAKKWAKLSSLINFKYMKYLKELEQLAPDEAEVFENRKLTKSKSKKKKNKKKQ